MLWYPGLHVYMRFPQYAQRYESSQLHIRKDSYKRSGANLLKGEELCVKNTQIKRIPVCTEIR